MLKSPLTKGKTKGASWKSGKLPRIFLGHSCPFCVTAQNPNSAKLETSLMTVKLSLMALKDPLPQKTYL